MKSPNRLIAIGFRGSAFLPKGAPTDEIAMNSWQVLKWERYEGRDEEIFDLSQRGKLSGCRTTDLSLFVGKAQWGRQSARQPREVWIGTIDAALKQKLVARCEFSFRSKRVEGFKATRQLKFQYLATLANAAGRIELEAVADHKGFDRNSSLLHDVNQLHLKLL